MLLLHLPEAQLLASPGGNTWCSLEFHDWGEVVTNIIAKLHSKALPELFHEKVELYSLASLVTPGQHTHCYNGLEIV